MTVTAIPPAELASLASKGTTIHLIDVCTPAEYGEAHIVFAASAPLDRLDPRKIVEAMKPSVDKPLYIICRSGYRGKVACERFIKAGFTNVVNVEGGMAACEAAGLPIVRGKKTISLDRQVRLAVGSFVLAGMVLGRLVNPGFYCLPVFMGAGLIFSGITDTCGMAVLIRRMPWNQRGVGDDAACSCITRAE